MKYLRYYEGVEKWYFGEEGELPYRGCIINTEDESGTAIMEVELVHNSGHRAKCDIIFIKHGDWSDKPYWQEPKQHERTIHIDRRSIKASEVLTAEEREMVEMWKVSNKFGI